MTINNCIKKLQNTLFLPACMLCGTAGMEGMSLCSRCFTHLKDNHTCCQRCSLPLETAVQVTCPACQTSPPDFHSSFIPYQYHGDIIRLIRNFKFSGNLTSGRLLADLFCRKLAAAEIPLPDALVPVPLHPSRTRQRGFNQALWLAHQIGRQLQIPVARKLVRRRLKSPSQHLLTRQERLENLKDAFQLEKGTSPARIGIIDDVVTTGTTANAVAGLFNHTHNATIQLWAIARTPLK